MYDNGTNPKYSRAARRARPLSPNPTCNHCAILTSLYTYSRARKFLQSGVFYLSFVTASIEYRYQWNTESDLRLRSGISHTAEQDVQYKLRDHLAYSCDTILRV